jgi:hypothetical protein
MSQFTINKEKFAGDMQQLIADYYKQNISRISDPRFHDIMICNVTGQVIEKYAFECHNFELLREIVEEEHEDLFNQNYYYIRRTCEHYIGNAYTIEYGQEADAARLYTMAKMATIQSDFTNVIHIPWQYTVGKMLYENETGAKIGDPIQYIDESMYKIKIGIHVIDGIVENMESPLYGRIVKINNSIKYTDGIPNIRVPCEEDWIQMQMQMQYCDLDFCDYIETQIGEYETEEEFFKDEERTRGIILVLQDSANKIVYKFMPVDIQISMKEIKAWMETVYDNTYRFAKTIYWYLDNFEMTLVMRNHHWFEAI